MLSKFAAICENCRWNSTKNLGQSLPKSARSYHPFSVIIDFPYEPNIEKYFNVEIFFR
jgi:hypothetical protein